MYLNINARRSPLARSSLIDALIVDVFFSTRLYHRFSGFVSSGLARSPLCFSPPFSPNLPSPSFLHYPIAFNFPSRLPRERPERKPVHNAAWRFVIGNILSRLRTYCFAPFAPLSRCMPTHTVHLTRIERDSDSGVSTDLCSREFV